MAKGRSPLKGSPLRNPGQSLDEEIHNVLYEKLLPYYFSVVFLWAITLIEAFGAWRNLPRKPWIYGFVALVGTALLVDRFFKMRRQVQALRLGRDGERVVGQYLDGLRETELASFTTSRGRIQSRPRRDFRARDLRGGDQDPHQAGVKCAGRP